MSRLSQRAEEEIAALRRLLLAEEAESRSRDRARLEDKSAAQLERDGVLARRLVVIDRTPALLGRARLVLGEDPSRPGHLAGFGARSGSVVAAGSVHSADGARGVVSRVERGRLVVVFDEPPDREDRDLPLDLWLPSDEVSLGRLLEGLRAAERAEGRAAAVVELVLGTRPPRPIDGEEPAPLDLALNPDQRQAMRKAVLAEDLALIHGPFGTGKTTVLVEVVRQAVSRGERVACLAASNAAVDHLCLALLAADPDLPLLRVGHPARAHPALEAHTLAAKIEDHPRRKLARDLADQAAAQFRRADRWSRAADGAAKRREAREDARALLGEVRQLERQASEEVIDKSRIIAGTLTGFGRDLPPSLRFDRAVIDEASQALTPAVLLAALRSERLILAGDHRQLPPTVLSREAAAGGLSHTVFDALIEGPYGSEIGHLLTVQHRMHSDLMAFPSAQFYGARLVAHPAAAARCLADLGVTDGDLVRSTEPLAIIDTAGAGMEERAEVEGTSRDNPKQAAITARVVVALISSGLTPEKIAVISPYAAQVAALVERLSEWTSQGLEIDTVDGFQGREKEAIVFDAVRSNTGGELGFLSDLRRLNVAITRARRKLVIVADSATLSFDSVWAALFEHAARLGVHRSVFEIDGGEA